ncbi:22584_t:CDS:2, partial [Cetraspora pellucida]
LHNNPPNQINIADARCLPAYLERHMMVLKNANTGDFDNAVKCNILKSMIEVADNNAQVLGFLKSYLTECGQNLSGRISEKSITPASQQQEHTISLENIQKAVQNALVQQKTKNQTLIKKVTELESQMAKQTAPQTVEPVKQPKGIFSTEDLERNYPIKPFQKPYNYEDDKGEYNEEENRWHALSQLEKKTSTTDKPSDFAIKGNFKHISESLEWYIDVPISVKDKDDKIVMSTGNFAHINNGESEPMLCIGVSKPEQQTLDMHNGEDLKI